MYTSFTDWESGIYLQHHGIRGQKWGVRKYQNPDGSLTAAGRERYGVAEGGNRRMERLYKRETKRLAKLQSRADLDTQRANVAKYNKRAKIAAGVGVGAAGIAAGAYYGNQYLGKLASAAIKAKYKEANAAVSKADADVHALWRADKQAYDANGNWNGKGYSQETWDKIQKVSDDMHAKSDKLTGEAHKIKEDFNRGAVIRKAVAYGAAGVAAVSAGVAVYSKIQSHMAKKRLSEVGHTKAVQNAQAQVAKMEKMFANTPYAELLRKQNRKRS